LPEPLKITGTDKQTERLRYDARAQSLLTVGCTVSRSGPAPGSLAIPPIFRAPYTYYEQCIRRFISQDHDVLELGSGTGLHTYVLTQTGARVMASDISIHSLEVLAQRIGAGIVKTRVADIESLPFETGSFDVVAAAGSLSYGNPDWSYPVFVDS
jgi:SAM-dependent methyltransferase